MYKEKTENVEVYFICYKKDEMELIEKYYDEILDLECWYFNAYLAYQYWKIKFKNIKVGKLEKIMLIVAASKYLIYQIENELFENSLEYKRVLKDLNKINKKLVKITKGLTIFQ